MTLPWATGKLRKQKEGGISQEAGGRSTATIVATGVVGLGGGIVAMLYLAYPEPFQLVQLFAPRPVTVAAGTLLSVAGIALTCWARYTLAEDWVGGPFLHDAHHLVVSGPYRLVRHPMYSGFAVFHVGLLIATGNPTLLLSDGLLRAMLLHQSLAEERLLAERFGTTYNDYQARTGRFFPRLIRR